MKLPSVSVVIATYNSEKTILECLESVAAQRYPRNSIEIILADGGSRDGTLALAKTFGARVIRVPKDKQGAEYNRAIGAHAAKGELLLFLDHDNVLPHPEWLQRMVMPLRQDKTIIGVETLRYAYDKQDSYIGRYFALFGVNDIFAFYVGKADRLSYMYDTPSSYGVFKHAHVTEKPDYFVVDFDKHSIPTLGSNGFLIRKKILFDNARVDPDEFFHIDVNVDLIRKGYSRYAFIKDVLRHKTDERGLLDYLRRRKLFMERYHFAHHRKRRYSLYEAGDLGKTIWFVFCGLTFVVPFADSIRGFLRIADPAWFLNPVMSFCLVILYGFVIIKRLFLRYADHIMAR